MIEIVFKNFDSFPDRFEDLQKLKKIDFLSFLFSIVELYNGQLQENNKKFDFIKISDIRELVKEILKDKEDSLLRKRKGVMGIKDIVNLLFSIIKLQINLRDAEIIEEAREKERMNAQLRFLLKYLYSLYAVAREKFKL